jgi:hypothetical protein
VADRRCFTEPAFATSSKFMNSFLLPCTLHKGGAVPKISSYIMNFIFKKVAVIFIPHIYLQKMICQTSFSLCLEYFILMHTVLLLRHLFSFNYIALVLASMKSLRSKV